MKNANLKIGFATTSIYVRGRILKLVEKSLTRGTKKNPKQSHHNPIVLAASRRQKWIDMLNYNSSCTGGSLRSIWSPREDHLKTLRRRALGQSWSRLGYFSTPPLLPFTFPLLLKLHRL